MDGREKCLISTVERRVAQPCFCGSRRALTVVEVTDDLDSFSETRCAMCGAAFVGGDWVPVARADESIQLWPA